MTGPGGPWWFLSFAEEGEGGAFIGACVVRGPTAHAALAASHEACSNPGGAVAAQAFPAGTEPPEAFRGRLLLREDCEALKAALEEAAAERRDGA